MCLLIVPEEMLKNKAYSEEFERYWQLQVRDDASIIKAEKETDKAFLQMVKQQLRG